MLAGTRQPQRGTVTLDGAPLTGFSARRPRPPHGGGPAGDAARVRLHRREVAMMGRYPHLGAFEIEGPADIAVIEETLTSTGTLHLKDRLVRHAQRRREAARGDRGGAGADLPRRSELPPKGGSYRSPTQTESRSFRLQAEHSATGYLLLDEPTASLDLGYQLEIASLLTQLHEERRVGDRHLDPRPRPRRHAVRQPDADPRRLGRRATAPTDDVLTPDNVREVYGVDAEIIRHPSGQRVVVPVRRTGRAGPRDDAAAALHPHASPASAR